MTEVHPRPNLGWVILIFIAALLPRVTTLGVFLAHDETLFWDWSHKFFFSLLNGDLAGTIVGPGNPSIVPIWGQVILMAIQYGWASLMGVQAEALAEWNAFQPHLVFSELPLRRLPVVLINTTTVAAMWYVCHRLFGARLALLAAILFIFDPFFLSDSRTGRGEGMLSGFVTLSLLLFILYWQGQRLKHLILSGIVLGLALLTKMSAVSLIPTAGLITLIYIWQLPNPILQKMQRLIWVMAVWGIVAIVTFVALWPAIWVAPLETFEFLFGFARNVGVEGRTNYFFGELYRDEFLPFYYLVVLILRVTPVSLLGLIIFFVLLARLMMLKIQSARPWVVTWQALTQMSISPAILLVALFPLVFGLFMTVGVLKRDWYLMPAFPALDIVAAAGLFWLLQNVRRFFSERSIAPKLHQQVSLNGVGAVLLLQGFFGLSGHPIYYTHWNPLVRGGQWAEDAVMVGWDVDLGMGAHYLNSKPDASNLKTATRTTRGFQEIFHGETLDLAVDSNWVQADYLIVRQTHLQLGKHDPWELVYLDHLTLDHIVNIEGVDYLWVYEAPAVEYFAGASQLVGKGILYGYDLSSKDVAVGDSLTLDAYWLNQGLGEQEILFARLIDPSGEIWAETELVNLPGFPRQSAEPEIMTESQAALQILVGTPPGQYTLQMGVFNQAKSEEVGLFTLDDAGQFITVTPAIESLEPPTMAHPLDQTLTSDVALLGFSLPKGDLTFGPDNRLELFWQTEAAPERDLAIGLQLLDEAGGEATYWLGRPVNGGYPTTEWGANQIIRDPWQLDLPAEVAPGDYTLALTLYDGSDSSAVGTLDLTKVTVVERRRLFDPPPMQETVGATLGENISLLGYDLFQEPLLGGGRVTLRLVWQAQQTVLEDYTVFVQILRPDGTVAGQHDGIPAETLNTTTWQANEIVLDQHLVDFPTDQVGTYQLIVGMYNPVTSERLPISDKNQIPIGDFIPLHTIAVDEAVTQ